MNHSFDSGTIDLSLSIPVNVQLEENPPPLEECIVMERVARAYLRLKLAVEAEDEKWFSTPNGFGPELCKIFHNMAKLPRGTRMEVSFSWSHEYKPPADLENIKPFSLSVDAVFALMEKATKARKKAAMGL